jgi:signal transduction histidine kinase
VIQPGQTPTLPERPYAEGSASPRGSDLLPRVLGALPAGIALFELSEDDFVYRCGNREFGRVLSLDRMPRDGQRVAEVFHRGDKGAIVELLYSAVRNREPQSYFAAGGREREGSQPIWNIDAYPVFSGARISHLLVLAEQTHEKLEIRQRLQFEANRLRQKADQLADLEKAKSEFLRLASHELRGPAAMLSGYLSMIEDGSMGPIPGRLATVLPLLKGKAAQINMLASEMVEAARLEDRRLQLKRKRIDVREVVRRSLEIARAAATPQHHLHFEDQLGQEVWVLGDLMRLDIIIANLLDNAVKYSPGGGEITVQLTRAGGMALLAVRDTGIGIAAEDMQRLFVRFSRLAPLSDVPGTGLGLYLARELARLHGGDIMAVSKAGEGSEFTLSLPLEPLKK